MLGDSKKLIILRLKRDTLFQKGACCACFFRKLLKKTEGVKKGMEIFARIKLANNMHLTYTFERKNMHLTYT